MTAANPAGREAAMAGLRAYQAAPRVALREAAPVVAATDEVRVRDHGGSGRPVLFVPSLINPPFVLDLAPGNSLVDFVAAAGFRTLLLEWGKPAPGDTIGIAEQVSARLVPLIEQLDQPPVLVGYCLGGTMALAAATLARVAGLALIATPWRFSGFGDAARASIASLWQEAQPAARALGLVPMEVLQAGFWQLDPARTIAKYQAFAAMPPDGEAAQAFVLLEDWANAGAPLSYAAGRALFEDFYAADLTGAGQWQVGGRTITPEPLACPAIEFVSETDRIVPAASSPGLPNARRIAAGHVGMVVGSRAKTVLSEPLVDWIRSLPGDR